MTERHEINLNDLIYDLQNLRIIVEHMSEQAQKDGVDYSQIKATADSLAKAIQHALAASDKQRFYSKVKDEILYSEIFAVGGDLNEIDKARIDNLGLF